MKKHDLPKVRRSFTLLRVMNSFDVIGIAPCLEISLDALRDAFREAGKHAHPDAGGAEDDFSKLREAFDILSSPSRRLKLWLELRSLPVEIRGAIDPELMDLFSEVGEATQRAQLLVRRRDTSKSALALALLERETQLCREGVEKAIRKVDAAITAECGVFPEFERAEELDLQAALMVVRNLAFLEKWQAGLRSLFSKLV